LANYNDGRLTGLTCKPVGNRDFVKTMEIAFVDGARAAIEPVILRFSDIGKFPRLFSDLANPIEPVPIVRKAGQYDNAPAQLTSSRKDQQKGSQLGKMS